MQADSPAQGVSTIPRRRRLEVLLAIAAIVVIAAMALLVWEVPLASSGVVAEDANLKVGGGSAIIHDDAGNMPLSAGSAVIHDDAGNMKSY